jgi:hypothetical protein
MYRSHASVDGPSKPSSMSSTEGGFTLTASMAALGLKLGTNPWIGQPACCALCREPFFSGAMAMTITVDDFAKGCHVRRLLIGSIRIVLISFSLQGVHRFESPRLSDMSNHLFMTAIK